MRQLILPGWLWWSGLVDPCPLGQVWRPVPAAEPFGVLGVGAVQGELPSSANLGRGAEMD
jgi:hypothetical protein